MLFTETLLSGCWIVDIEQRYDERGFLARTYSADEFADRGLCTHWVQMSTVLNSRANTLRGMHFQRFPHGEIKLVRCISGRVYDVVIDMRPTSTTFRQWTAIELSAQNRRMVYIPEGMAHGMQTLDDNSELFYMMSAFYAPEAAGGVRWNDPAFAIEWPRVTIGDRIIADRDQQWPDFT